MGEVFWTDVQGIAEETEGEDRYGESVAGAEGVTAEEAGEGFVVVFCVVSELGFVERDKRGRVRNVLPLRATMLEREC